MTPSSASLGSMRGERLASRSEAEAQTQARSGLYRLLGPASASPEGALHGELEGGAWDREVAEALEALPFSLNLADLSLKPTELSAEHLQAEHVRPSDVGFTGGPLCSLLAGHRERDRQHLIEELVRFDDFFGLRLAPGKMPDHLALVVSR